MEIRLFQDRDFDRVISLWQKIFGDSEEFIRGFLKISKPKTNTLVAFIDEKPCAMINFPEISLIRNGREYKGIYLFAVCVDESYRKMGIFRQMSEKIDEIAISRKYDFAFLIPQNADLFKMYEKLGYTEKCASYFPYECDLNVENTNFSFDVLYEKYRNGCINVASFIKDKELFAYTVEDKLCDGCEIGEACGGYVIYKNHGEKKIIFDTNIPILYENPQRYGLFKVYRDINFGENIKFSLFFED